MRSIRPAIVILFFMLLASVGPPALAEGPLEAFGARVEGEWQAEDSRHVFEWGVGRRLVRSRSYQKMEDEWRLVSEGMWFWDPGQETIRGVVVALGMPVELFEYRSKIEGPEVVHDLIAQGPAGGEYVERWVFGDGTYSWSLEVDRDGKLEPIMAGSYRRAGSED